MGGEAGPLGTEDGVILTLAGVRSTVMSKQGRERCRLSGLRARVDSLRASSWFII